MLYDPIRGQGQGHRGTKVAKIADFKVCFLRRYVYAIKRLTMNYDNPKQYLNFTRTDF